MYLLKNSFNEHSNIKYEVQSIGKVITIIYIMVSLFSKSNDINSCQIILTQRQINTKNDIFICFLIFFVKHDFI